MQPKTRSGMPAQADRRAANKSAGGAAVSGLGRGGVDANAKERTGTMIEQFPKSKVATYHVWPEGEARFSSCNSVAWSIQSAKTGNGHIVVGEDVEVTNDCGTFAAMFAGVFAKEGAECPVVRVDEPPLAYYVFGAWSDSGDGNFPPAFALRPAGPLLDGIRFQPFAAGFFPGSFVATLKGECKVKDIAAGNLVLAWDADAVPPTRAGRPTRDDLHPVRAKRIGRKTVSELIG